MTVRCLVTDATWRDEVEVAHADVSDGKALRAAMQGVDRIAAAAARASS